MADIIVKGHRAQPTVDLTPMVDLGFLLITFFILSTTLQKPATLSIQMPYKDAPKGIAATKDHATVTLFLDAGHQLYYVEGMYDGKLNKQDLKRLDTQQSDLIRKELKDKVLQINSLIKSGHLDAEDALTIIVKPMSNSTVEDLVNVVDILQQEHLNLYVITEPSEYELNSLQ